VRQLPPRWTREQFNGDREKAVAIFREQRMQEPLEKYLKDFDDVRAAVEELLEMTVNLTQLNDAAANVLTDPALLEAVRYLAGPPVSLDDLRVLADATLSPKSLRGDPTMARRVIDTILLGLDRNRFPWVAEDREPTEAEREAAALASAALIASRRVMTARANESKEEQERAVAARLIAEGFFETPSRPILTLDQAPGLGEFCGESLFGSRKADLVVRLWDRRVMPLECKVSNSSTNSIKRLNNDAAVKADVWLSEFGTVQTVPAAMLAGVYNTRNLEQAQERGLTVFWAHDLDALVDFINFTRT
jgi:XamI restriction endonuclease